MLNAALIKLEVLKAMLANRQEEGQGLVEYALIIALVSIMAVAALVALSGGINTVFGNIVASF